MLQTLLTSTLPSIHHVQLSDKDRVCSDWTPQVEDLQGNKINLVLSFWETGNNKKDNRAKKNSFIFPSTKFEFWHFFAVLMDLQTSKKWRSWRSGIVENSADCGRFE